MVKEGQLSPLYEAGIESYVSATGHLLLWHWSGTDGDASLLGAESVNSYTYQAESCVRYHRDTGCVVYTGYDPQALALKFLTGG